MNVSSCCLRPAALSQWVHSRISHANRKHKVIKLGFARPRPSLLEGIVKVTLPKTSIRLHRLLVGTWLNLLIEAITGQLLPVAHAAEPATTERVDANAPEVPTLERVLALAMSRAPELRISQSTVEASRSSLVGARLWPVQNPYVEVVATRGFGGLGQGTNLTGTAWLPFEISGQRGRRIDEAESLIGMKVADLERTRANVRAAAVRYWGRALVESARIQTLTQIEASAEAEAKAFRARRDVGDATERDAQLAEVERARHGVLIEEARATLDGAMGGLTRLTGRKWLVPQALKVHPPLKIENLRASIAAAQSPLVQAPRIESNFYAKVDARLARDATGPLSVIVTGGRGEVGETLLGAGLGWSFPTFRRFQGERARAQAEQQRSLFESGVIRKDIETQLETIIREITGTRRALAVLENQALPAARAARQAAEGMFRFGKIDMLGLLVSRRDEALLQLSRLDLAEQEWNLAAVWAELTGEVPQ